MTAVANTLAAALERLLEVTDTPPARNCGCHIAPPCGDCVEYGGLREAIADAEAALDAHSKAQGDAGIPVSGDALVEAVRNHLESIDAYPENPVPINRDRGTTRALREALASQQPVVRVPVGRIVYSQNARGHGDWDFMPAEQAYAVLEITPKVGGQFADQRFDVYAAPPAPARDETMIDLAPDIRRPVWLLRAADEITAYMNSHEPGEWKISGIQKRNNAVPAPHAANNAPSPTVRMMLGQQVGQDPVCRIIQNDAGQVGIEFCGGKTMLDHVGATLYAGPPAHGIDLGAAKKAKPVDENLANGKIKALRDRIECEFRTVRSPGYGRVSHDDLRMLLAMIDIHRNAEKGVRP